MPADSTQQPPSSGQSDGSPRRRADARRNIDGLRGAAKAVFARSGVDAPAKEITDLAGVGVGTLYRHFPLRSDLIIAVLQQEIDQCVEAASALHHSGDPWEAIVEWMEGYVELVSTKSGLAAALHSGDPAYEHLPARLLEEIEPPFRALLDRAMAAGLVRADVTARDILISVALICHPVPGEALAFNRRMIGIYLDGLARQVG